MSANTSDRFPLGTAPRPVTGEDLVQRLHDAARQLTRPEDVTGLERARFGARLDGADIADLDVDLTGVGLTSRDAEPPELSPPAERSREAAVLRRARFGAHPLTVLGLAVDLRGEAEDVPFAWIEGVDGSLWAEPLEPTGPVRGSARVEVRKSELVETARRLIGEELERSGMTLRQLDLDVEAQGPRAVRIRVDARIRKGILSASAWAVASASVDDAMVLTIGEVKLSSANPIIAAVLAVVRGRVEAAAHQRIDLNAEMPPGVRLADVRFEAGDELALMARLA